MGRFQLLIDVDIDDHAAFLAATRGHCGLWLDPMDDVPAEEFVPSVEAALAHTVSGLFYFAALAETFEQIDNPEAAAVYRSMTGSARSAKVVAIAVIGPRTNAVSETSLRGVA